MTETQDSLSNNFLQGKIDRRTFLQGLATIGLAAGLAKTLTYLYQKKQLPLALTPSQDKIIIAVQEHLFPKTKDAPGSQDINATEYLHLVLHDQTIDIRDRKFIKNGIGWLEEKAQEKYNRSFIDLNVEEKENIFQEISQVRWGEGWLSSLLSYIFEALLSDPIYGANPEGIGWKWLNHQAGYPRPKHKFNSTAH